MRKYVAARNTEEEVPGLNVWGVWDQEHEIWADDHVSEHWNEAQIAANQWEFEEDSWRLIQDMLVVFYDPAYVTPYLMCIRSQEDWKYVETRADIFAGRQFEPGPQAYDEGMAFAVTGLVECHDGPHHKTCPDYRA